MRLMGSFQTNTIHGRSGTVTSSMSLSTTSTGTGVGAMVTFCRLAVGVPPTVRWSHGRRRSPPGAFTAGKSRPATHPYVHARRIHRSDQAANHRVAADHHRAHDGAGPAWLAVMVAGAGDARRWHVGRRRCQCDQHG